MMMEGATVAALQSQGANPATQPRPRGMSGSTERLSGSRSELASRVRTTRHRDVGGGGERRRPQSAELPRRNSFGEHQETNISSRSTESSTASGHQGDGHSGSGSTGHHENQHLADSAHPRDPRRSSTSHKVVRRSPSGAGGSEGIDGGGGDGRERRKSGNAFAGDAGAFRRVDGGRAGSAVSMASHRASSRSPRRSHESRPAINPSSGTGGKRRSRVKSSSGTSSSGGGGAGSGSLSGGGGNGSGNSSGSGGGAGGEQSSDRSPSPGNLRPTSGRRHAAGDIAMASGHRGTAASRSTTVHRLAAVDGGFARSPSRSSHPVSRGPAGASAGGRSGSGGGRSGSGGGGGGGWDGVELLSSSSNRDESVSLSLSPPLSPTKTTTTPAFPPPSPRTKIPSGLSSTGVDDIDPLPSPDRRDRIARGGPSQASPISRAAAAAARGGGKFSLPEAGNQSGDGGGGGVQLTSHTRPAGAGDRPRRSRAPPSQVFNLATEGGEEGPPEQQPQRPHDASPMRGEQRRPGEHGRRERGSRGSSRKRAGGPRGMPRGRPTGRSGSRKRRSASMPQSYRRGPGAFGLAPVKEEEKEEEVDEDGDGDHEGRQDGAEGEEEEGTEELELEMKYKVVNKDTGEVIDLRDEGMTDAHFDVLPTGFRPSEAWHPELQEHAAKAAASPLDLAGSELSITIDKHPGAERKASSSKPAGGSRFAFNLMRGRGPKSRDLGFVGGGGGPITVGSGPTVEGATATGKVAGGLKERTSARHAAAEEVTAQSAMEAAATVSWPKLTRDGPATSGVGDSKRQSSTLSTRASVLLGLVPPGEPPTEKPGRVVSTGPRVETNGGSGAGAGGGRVVTSPAERRASMGGERGTSPSPPIVAAPRTSPGSGERGPTRQEMAAAQVAKRREALKHRGLMESAILQGVGGVGMAAAAAAALRAVALPASAGGGNIIGGAGDGGHKIAPLRISTADSEDKRVHSGGDHTDESPKVRGGGSGGDLLMSPGFQALAAAATGGHPGGGPFSPQRNSMVKSMTSPRTGAARSEALEKAMVAVEAMKPLQRFKAHTGAVWCAEFSRKGQYLATGGADGLVKIWEIGAAQEDSDAPSNREKVTGSPPARVKSLERSDSDVSLASLTSVVSISTTAGGSSRELDGATSPVVPTGQLVVGGRASRVMRGHHGDVVDLSWSPNAFLLSAGRDGSLRLWHPGRLGCVHLFPQTGPATPTSCAFHPRLENSFVTAGEDGKIRVWKITSARVEVEAKMPTCTTHVRFSPDGKVLAAGMQGGQVRFLTWETLQPMAQVDLRSRKSSTGISSIAFKSSSSGKGEVLVHGSAGRLRLFRLEPLAAGSSAISAAVDLARKYGLSDKSSCLISKIARLKGHVNPSIPVRATVSEDGRFAVCGSEDGLVHVWDARPDVEGSRRQVSFNATAPFPDEDNSHNRHQQDDDDDDFSLSPRVTGPRNIRLRSPSFSPPPSLSPTHRGRGRGTTTVIPDDHGNTRPSEEEGRGTKVGAGAGTGGGRPARQRRGSPFSRSPSGGPNSGAGKKLAAASEIDSASGGRRKGSSGAAPTGASTAGTGQESAASATVVTGVEGGAKPDGAGSGAAVTLASFVPKAALSRFQDANVLSWKTSRGNGETLVGLQRAPSLKSHPRRVSEIPAIAEVVPPEDPAAIDASEGVPRRGGGVDGEGQHMVRRSSAPLPRERNHHPYDQHDPHYDQQQQQVVGGGRRGSTGNAFSSNINSISSDGNSLARGGAAPQALPSSRGGGERDRRRAKKARGSAATDAGAGTAAAAADRGTRSHSPAGAGAGAENDGFRATGLVDGFPPRSPRKHRTQEQQQQPPPYVPQTLGDLLSSPSHPLSLLPPPPLLTSNKTPPPPYDPDAQWDSSWEKEWGLDQRERHQGIGGGGRSPSMGFTRGHGRPRKSFGSCGDLASAAAGSGSGTAMGKVTGVAKRVVTVEVYRSPDGVGESELAPREGEEKQRGRRGTHDRRNLGGIPGRERREGTSPVPLAEIMMSSPSASPTRPFNSPPRTRGTLPHSPIRTAATATVSSNPAPTPVLPPPNMGFLGGTGGREAGRDSRHGEFSWEDKAPRATGAIGENSANGGKNLTADAGSAAAGRGGGGESPRLPTLPPNSLMLSADSLGNVRIYATAEVLEAMRKSEFCAPRE